MGLAANLGYLLIEILYAIIHSVFVLINFFIKRRHVPAPSNDLVMLSATKLVNEIKRRKVRPTEIVEAYIHRIEQVNSLINAAVVTLFDEARTIAKRYDQEIDGMSDEQLQNLLCRRPLYGVPFSCKDSIAVEGHIVTCGSYYQRNHRCERTAAVVQRMRDAGAILLAITNVPELCAWVESVNKVYGRTNNPYDVRRIVGGSSGGEAALLSAAGTPVGVGSDVGGSIRIPCFMNGIFGLMPTPDIVPLDGNLPTPVGYKARMLRDGPMCRYVEDLRLLFRVMAGDKSDGLHLERATIFSKCRLFYMFGVRHPIVEPLGGSMRDALNKAVAHFETKFNLEGICLDLPLVYHHPKFYAASQEGNIELSRKVLSLKGDCGKLNVWAEIPKLISGKSHHTTAVIIAIAFEKLCTGTEESKAEVIKIRDRLKRQLVETLGDDGLLFFPTWPKAAPFHNEPLFAVLNTAFTALFNVLALPAVQCPVGLDKNGIPVGVQIVAAPGCDRLLVAAAEEMASTFGGWIPPWKQ